MERRWVLPGGGALSSHTCNAASLPPWRSIVNSKTSSIVHVDMEKLLTRWEIAWCDVLHKSQMNVLNFMHTLPKPTPGTALVPQLGHTQFASNLRIFFRIASACKLAAIVGAVSCYCACALLNESSVPSRTGLVETLLVPCRRWPCYSRKPTPAPFRPSLAEPKE